MLRRLSTRWKPWQIDASAALLIAALGAGAYLFQIGPVYRQYRDRDARAAQLAELATRQREAEAELGRQRHDAAEMRRFLAGQHLLLEPRSRLNDRLTAICNLASDCGLTPDSIEPEGETAEPRFLTIGLKLSGRGSYRDCLQFLERLREKMPHSTFAGLQISAPPASSEPTVSFTFHLLWHASPTPPTSN